MEHLSEISMRRICKILMQRNNEEEKKLRKYKVVNRNIKKYNKIGQLKIKGKITNEKFNEIAKKIKIFDAIKRMEVNVEDYKMKYDCEEDDQDVKDNDKVERFNCKFEACKQSYKHKNKFVEHFINHLTDEFTCKQCNSKFTLKDTLNRHLLLHENKRQIKCLHEGCSKTFNTKIGLNQHKVVHLENKLFKCNDCSFETNRSFILNNHIKGKHTRQGLIKCKWPGCHKEFTKINLHYHMRLVHSTNQFKCTFDGCEFVTKYKQYFKIHCKKVHLK